MSNLDKSKDWLVCKCPQCGNIKKVEGRVPCNNIPCSKCGVLMKRGVNNGQNKF